MDSNTPVLFEIAQPSLRLTLDDLADVDHAVNIKGVSGKRKGLACMIGTHIYMAQGSNPDSEWTRITTPELDNMIPINTFSDFPDPLLPNKVYEIGGNIIFPDELPATWSDIPDNIDIRGSTVASRLTYEGTEPFLTLGDAGRFRIDNVLLDVPNAKIYEFNDTTGTTIVNLLTASILRAKEVGTLNVFAVVMKVCNCVGLEQGITLGDKNIIIDFQEILAGSDSTSFEWLDMTDCTQLSSVDISINRVNAPTGSVAFKGLSNNANLTTSTVANFSKCVMLGGVTALSGITNDDAGYKFDNVTGLIDSKAIGYCYITTPVNTTIADGVEVNVEGIFSAGSNQAQASSSVDGKITMLNRIEKRGTVTIGISLDKSGGGASSDKYILRVYRTRNAVTELVDGTEKELDVIGSATTTKTIHAPTNFVNGDVYHLTIEGIGTNDDITAITENFTVTH